MQLTLHTETVIETAHHLEGYEGACSRKHGHSTRIRLWFRGDSNALQDIGILVDFGIVKTLKDQLDHKDLNELPGFEGNPTAENMSMYVYNFICKQIDHGAIKVAVRYYETAIGKETYCDCGDFEPKGN